MVVAKCIIPIKCYGDGKLYYANQLIATEFLMVLIHSFSRAETTILFDIIYYYFLIDKMKSLLILATLLACGALPLASAGRFVCYFPNWAIHRQGKGILLVYCFVIESGGAVALPESEVSKVAGTPRASFHKNDKNGNGNTENGNGVATLSLNPIDSEDEDEEDGSLVPSPM
jgi:hypothetical protein